ncbi:MAG: hypothetical protein ABW169_09610 [Sphingobium sp.]
MIRNIVRDRMVQSGVDNYAFVDGHLQIGSTRYAVEACGCGEQGCDGVRLRRVQRDFEARRRQPEQGFSTGLASGTA